MTERPIVAKIAAGTFLVRRGGKQEVVYVAGQPGERWAFENGRVYQQTADEEPSVPTAPRVGGQAYTLTAPMPATVIKVAVDSGKTVKKGEPVIVLEAMKMEWPVRALADGVVKAVRCQEGELVKADQPLAEME